MSNQGYFRLSQIVGDPKADPPIEPIIPISRATLWAWVKAGKFPAPVKLGPRVTAWRKADVLAHVAGDKAA